MALAYYITCNNNPHHQHHLVDFVFVVVVVVVFWLFYFIFILVFYAVAWTEVTEVYSGFGIKRENGYTSGIFIKLWMNE